jgi:hypothetical protein
MVGDVDEESMRSRGREQLRFHDPDDGSRRRKRQCVVFNIIPQNRVRL